MQTEELGWLRSGKTASLALALISSTSVLTAQSPDETARVVATAARTTKPPELDGAGDDAVWHLAPAISDFRMFSPHEGATPTIRTEARLLYDDRALYVLVRAYDEHPDSIVRLLARRDTDGPPNDQVLVFIDSYHDSRSGYQFVVNPAGVKSDYLLFDDGGSDRSWDGIWEVATAIDSLGWVAEFAFPLHQFRFSDLRAPTFGLLIGRWVGRTDERVSWPLYRRSRAGLVSQFGTLEGLRDLPRHSALELTPYVLARSANLGTGNEPGEWQAHGALGADLKWVPRPDLSINATVNPDFGHVEADPAVLNLTGIEVFQPEQRPFFMEGAGLLNLPLATDGSSRLFYSRRIGRRPTLLDDYGAARSTRETTILGSAKVTARPARNLSLAILSSLTGTELGATRPTGGRHVIEPVAHYGALRVQQDLRGGRSGVGMMLTRVDRDDGDSLVDRTIPSAALALALTTQHQTADGALQLSAWGALSDVRGSAAAISRLQLSPVHAFHRPGDAVVYDPGRTKLRGSAAYLSVAKVGRGATRFSASYRRIGTGFDVNEAGFLTRDNVQTVSTDVGLNSGQAGKVFGVHYRRAEVLLGFGGDWSTEGLPYGRGFNLKASLQLPSQATIQGEFVAQLPGAYCTASCTQGGPALYDPPRRTVTVDVSGPSRHALVPHVNMKFDSDDGGRTYSVAGQLDVTWRLRSNLNVSLAASASNAVHAWHYYAHFGDPVSDTAHYTVARLDQATRALTARFNYTIAPALTLQWYSQAHVSRGAYSDVRELADPRAPDPSRRFRTYRDSSVVGNPRGIDFKRLRSNLVLRWEYRPASTLFLVWSQGRDIDGDAPAKPGLWPGADFRDLLNAPPANVVALKGSFWFTL